MYRLRKTAFCSSLKTLRLHAVVLSYFLFPHVEISLPARRKNLWYYRYTSTYIWARKAEKKSLLLPNSKTWLYSKLNIGWEFWKCIYCTILYIPIFCKVKLPWKPLKTLLIIFISKHVSILVEKVKGGLIFQEKEKLYLNVFKILYYK